jgi:hypothetical protein
VNKLDLLFDSKQFDVAFGEALGESNSLPVCRPDANAHSEGESPSVGAGLSLDGGQNVVHAATGVRYRSRPTPIVDDVSDEV